MLARWLALAIVVLSAGATPAQDFSPALRTLFEGFESHRRVALGYLRTGNTDLAAVELDRLVERWRRDLHAIGTTERSLERSIDGAEERVEDSRSALETGDIDKAANELERAATPLKAWRDTVGIRLFSDCIGELSQTYERLNMHRVKTPDLGNAGIRDAIVKATSETEAAVRRCDDEAAPDRKSDPGFRRLINGMLGSLRQMRDAIAKSDSGYLYRLLIEQRSFERLLSFRFG